MSMTTCVVSKAVVLQYKKNNHWKVNRNVVRHVVEIYYDFKIALMRQSLVTCSLEYCKCLVTTALWLYENIV